MLDNSMFYINFEELSEKQRECINKIKQSEIEKTNPIYILNKPIIDKKTNYNYTDAFLLLVPKHKMIFIDFGHEPSLYEEYRDDFIDDIGYIAKKYNYLNFVGRPRQWKEKYISEIKYCSQDFSFENLLINNEIKNEEEIRQNDILISLTTGSINDEKRIGITVPQNILDQIKRKIILFDGDQTKFIYDEPNKKRITIQGLAGTGKTELLLHKIKELYTNNENSKIVFTCYNEILADTLRKRLPDFFNFMKVEEQIQWGKRLWIMRSWGSFSNKNSGVYSYICNHYNIPFKGFTYSQSFDNICKEALAELDKIEDFQCCFDYILIDESQDFGENFFILCEKIAKKCVYIAGDIFQDIFENKPLSVVKPDFLLNKCYRTDPRTLMGAHAIGMGLFEQKLRWLDDNQWEDCGYRITRKDNIFELHREPLRRFEDIDIAKTDGITILPSDRNNYCSLVLTTLNNLKQKYATILPEDIGIIFMENINVNFTLASNLQFLIKENFDWDVNIGYESREKKANTLLISNKNNVKGLEFPFVICIVQNDISNSFIVRNSIYMMLTRSFLTSFLIMPNNAKNLDILLKEIDFVNKNGYLKLTEPTKEEKEKLANTIIERTNIHKSLNEMTDDIMNEFGLTNPKKREKIYKLTQAMFETEFSYDDLKEFIFNTISFMDR